MKKKRCIGDGSCGDVKIIEGNFRKKRGGGRLDKCNECIGKAISKARSGGKKKKKVKKSRTVEEPHAEGSISLARHNKTVVELNDQHYHDMGKLKIELTNANGKTLDKFELRMIVVKKDR